MRCRTVRHRHEPLHPHPELDDTPTDPVSPHDDSLDVKAALDTIDGENVTEATHTTPGPVELQSLLRKMANNDCRGVAMEISSHALEQKRTDSVARAFDMHYVFELMQGQEMPYSPCMPHRGQPC